jgi:hypothetical protein
LFKNIPVLLVSVIAALALFEIGLRAADISYPVFDDYDPVRGMRLRPGKTGWYRKEGHAYLSINSVGYRDVERPRVKAPGTFRIAVLGDSFTEARQVPSGEAIWSLLEGDLSRCRPLSAMKVEVMNFGIGGTHAAVGSGAGTPFPRVCEHGARDRASERQGAPGGRQAHPREALLTGASRPRPGLWGPGSRGISLSPAI